MAGNYRPGDTYSAEFTTRGSTGSVNADSLPTASMAHNLVDDGAVTLTVTNIDTGRYSVTGTIPGGYSVGDKVAVKLAATVGGVSDKLILEQFVLDNRNSDISTSVASVSATVSGMNTNVSAIKTKTDSLNFTVSGKVDSNALNWNGTAISAALPTSFVDGANYTSARAGKLDNLDTTISSRSTFAGGAVASVTGSVGSVTGSVGSVAGVTLPSVVPSLAQIAAGLPTDTTIQADVIAALVAQGYTVTRSGKIDNLDAAISTRSTFAGGAVASVTAPVTVGTISDKTGYSLSSTGLDAVSIADVTSDADGRSTLPKMLRALFNRFYNKVDQTATTQHVYNDAGSVVSTLAVSDNGVTASKNKSA